MINSLIIGVCECDASLRRTKNNTSYTSDTSYFIRKEKRIYSISIFVKVKSWSLCRMIS